jgi:hypothetical protein
MPSRHTSASAAILAASVAWAVTLVLDSDTEATAVAATGLVVVAAVAAVAVMVENSRIGYWVGVFGLGLMLVVASLTEVSAAWIVSIVLTSISSVLMADPRLGGWIRAEAPVAPIPNRATALGGLLLVAPIATAISRIDSRGGSLIWLSLATWGVLLTYVRRLPGAVAAIRIGLPVLAGGGVLLDFPAALVWAGLLVAATALAWSKEVRLAVRPLIERGSRVSIPPELLPDDVRRAAGLDRKHL